MTTLETALRSKLPDGSPINVGRYVRLVAFAVERGGVPEHAQRHHVVPRGEGGTDDAANLVQLTPREHFLAHWLLYRIYRTPATARAFKLMVNDQRLRRGRDYAAARQIMADSMRGDNNVARRPDVLKKLRENPTRPFAGKKRPDHAIKMRAKGLIVGAKNPFYGQGDKQRGALNHLAKAVVGLHIYYGVSYWTTFTAAAQDLGVTLQAVSQAVRRKARCCGWRMEAVT